MRLVWRALGVPLFAELLGDMCLEGGDFLPVSADLCLLGIGLRTNWAAARFLLHSDAFGTRRVALVLDERDRSQARMHLDTVLNFADPHTAVLYEAVAGLASPLHRRVLVYERRSENDPYVLQMRAGAPPGGELELSAFLRAEGFRVVLLPEPLQREYAANFVHTGRDGGAVVAVCQQLPHVLRAAGCHVPVDTLELVGLTRMYGAAHCATQMLRRRHRSTPPVAHE